VKLKREWLVKKGIMQTIAFLGSSTTAGKGEAFDWIGALKKRDREGKFGFYNFGVGGDLAYGVRARLPEVIRIRPDKVVVLVGGNDVLVRVFENAKRALVDAKHLPGTPTPEWFTENLEAVVDELKSKTNAKIALVSLPPIGENMNSNEPIQKKLNQLIEQYSLIIKNIAEKEELTYIPLYERLRDQIIADPGRTLEKFRFRDFYWDAFRYFILRQSGDEIARKNGWKFHVDGVHLNSRGGTILTDLVEGFLFL
jgi:lysophospholipase L1-like esterase